MNIHVKVFENLSLDNLEDSILFHTAAKIIHKSCEWACPRKGQSPSRHAQWGFRGKAIGQTQYIFVDW